MIHSAEAGLTWPPAAAEVERKGALASVARTLLLATVPLCLVWFPIGTIPGAGNVTASDAALATLWILSLWSLATSGLSRVPFRPAAMPLLAILVGLFAAVGSEINAEGRGSFEFFLFLKRFGLAAVLPLAATLFRSREMGPRLRFITLASLAALAIFALVPSLQVILPRPPEFDASDAGPRATGLLTNPNDLAYTAVALAVLNGAFFPRRPRLLDKLLAAAALVACGACLVLAASRSGLLGGAAALTVVCLSRRVAAGTRLVLILSSALVLVVGLSTGGAFEERVVRVYRQGSEDTNVSSRLLAQRLALVAASRHPLGVGFTGYVEATSEMAGSYTPLGSDSVYFDTLLGAGVLGLLALLSLFFTAVRHVVRTAPEEGSRRTILLAGLLAFAVFGTASIIPISVATSPLYFSLIASACYPDAGAARRGLGRSAAPARLVTGIREASPG
jgi:O-antigen ligase